MNHKFCRILRQTLTCSIPSSQLFSACLSISLAAALEAMPSLLPE